MEDWHAPFVFFGYELILPPEMNLRTSIPLLYDLNGMIERPFEIRSILPCFPPTVDDTAVSDGMVCLIIGFSPTTTRDTHQRGKELAAYVVDNPIFEGFEISDSALFHCGIEWLPADQEVEDSDEESDQESDQESDKESDQKSDQESDKESDQKSDQEYEDDFEKNDPPPSPI
jgi:hypothetical protein